MSKQHEQSVEILLPALLRLPDTDVAHDMLRWACMFGSTVAVKHLAKYPSFVGNLALWLLVAAQHNHPALLRCLVEECAVDINAVQYTESGCASAVTGALYNLPQVALSLLKFLVEELHASIIKLEHTWRASVIESCFSNCFRQLHYSDEQALSIVQYLLDHGARCTEGAFIIARQLKFGKTTHALKKWLVELYDQAKTLQLPAIDSARSDDEAQVQADTEGNTDSSIPLQLKHARSEI